nr:MORC family CW type zinc finger protein 2B [Hymenolepis microstoma]
MSPDETKNVIVFGKSCKRILDQSSIGMYGNGLKSGSMRIGSDMILFTKKDGIYSCVFLSRTFHEAERLDEVIVPLPTFNSNDKTPIFTHPEDQKKHDTEMEIIYRFSPFPNAKDFFGQFEKIKGESGTVVVVYNMKLLDDGSAELDVNSNPYDIILASSSEREDPMEPLADIELPPEKRSLRAYVSILYSDPRMKVYIQSRKVQTKRLLDTLYATKRYNFASKTFRTRAERELNKIKEEVKVAEMIAREAESKARDFELRHGSSKDPEHLKVIRRLNNAASEKRNIVTEKQNIVARKQRALKDPKTLTFYFGINVVNRACDGMFVYNCSRLIKMYQRIGPQQDSSMTCRGVVGIVDVPYMVLEPTHNKQDFADAKEYRQLMRAMADHLMQYWDDLAIEKNGSEDVNRFWKGFGYLSARWRDPPSGEEKYARKRSSCVSLCVQCDKCLKWRVLPYSQNQVGREVPDGWQCRDNPDQKHKNCSVAEEDMNPPLGVLKRKIKTKEQRQAELEAQIRKRQEELEQIREADEEPLKASASGSKRLPPPPSLSTSKHTPSPPPTKRRTVTLSSPASPQRTLTVADRKRMAAAQQEATAKSAIATTRSSIGATPAPKSTSAARRVLRRRMSDSEEDEDDEEEVVVKKKRTTSATTRNATLPVVPVKREQIEAISSSSSEEEESYEEESTTLKKRTTTGKAASAKVSTIPTKKTTAVTANKQREAGKKKTHAGTEPVQTVAKASASSLQNGSKSDGVLDAQTSTQGEMTSKDTPSSSNPDNNISASKQIAKKLRNCLRYFLPPMWSSEKERIQLMSDAELAEFPLDSFFTQYETGLRALLDTVKSQATVTSEALDNLRMDVGRLLDRIAPTLQASSQPLEDVDTLVRKYLDDNEGN